MKGDSSSAKRQVAGLCVNKTWHYLVLVEKRRNGTLKPKQYERKLSRLLGKDLRASSNRSFERCCRTEDADVRENRMAVIDDAMLVIYDVSFRLGDQEELYERIAETKLPIQRQIAQFSNYVSIPTVRWSPEGSFLSTSGTSMDRNAVRILDSATMEPVEELDLNIYGSKVVLTHEHSRINPALMSIGTSMKQVLISDLRTGNITLSSGTRHTCGVNGIAWSFSDEHLLVTTSSKEILVWDTRYFSKTSALQLFHNDRNFDVITNTSDLKFVDNNHVVIMNSRKSIDIYNVYTGSAIQSIQDVRLRKEELGRFKFGLNVEAGIVYYPVKRGVRGYDLNTNNMILDARGGHIFPVDMVIFNDYSRELYTLNRHHEAIIWTPFR
uniref:DNA excision repair protein ERCC-8 n=2 Tax=Lygus hesperus TaxID=30085 RepID=A0A0A9XB15_LYGHE